MLSQGQNFKRGMECNTKRAATKQLKQLHFALKQVKKDRPKKKARKEARTRAAKKGRVKEKAKGVQKLRYS